MPIRPEYRAFYGRAWREYRAALLALRGSTCRACGRNVPKYLNLAHLTHDPRTSSVAFLCRACHARHDASHSKAVRRRNEAKLFGQIWLLQEIQYAETPAWAIPREVFAAAEAARQQELFT